MPTRSSDNAQSNNDAGSTSATKRLLSQLLKFGLATAVVVYMVSHGYIAWEPLRASLAAWRFSVPAFIALAFIPFGQFWRWQKLLRAGGVLLPHREIFSYVMVSKFFNTLLPGYVSGDIARGLFVFRRSSNGSSVPDVSSSFSDTKPSAQLVATSILFDRAAGLLPLFVMCLVGLIGTFWYAIPYRLLISALAIATIGTLGMSLVYLFLYLSPTPLTILRKLSDKLHFGETLSQLHVSSHKYVKNPRLILSIVMVSFLSQGAAVLSFILYGKALGVEIPLAGYLILVPLGLLLTAIPITTANLGVGQVAFLSLFKLLGTAQGANLFTLYAAASILINMTGAYAYITSRSSRTLATAP